nr:TraR/DksA C4-type zinc finger protein [uncultured Pseudomonas sp.]
MTDFDPQAALDALYNEYSERAEAIRRDMTRSEPVEAVEQAQQRQNDEVLNALLAEAEEGMNQVGLARLRLAEGRYGSCVRCAQPIEPARLQALPAARFCAACADS